MTEHNVIELDFNTNCSISNYTKYENKDEIISNLMCKQTLLMNTLNIYFKNIENLNSMIPIIVGKSSISLRILDWFVTNYAKKNNISYDVFDKRTNSMKKFIVHIDYKSQLKAYSKKYFDPFCRRERLVFIDNNNNEFVTTAGQLNFFRWVIDNDILYYIYNNLKTIENDMNNSIRHLYNNPVISPAEKKRRKRKELSVSATKSVNKHDINIIVSFE
tara:strand:+ start:113 stop:763 length:651 start_codon:yes stop_codon:yes gene_type:complete